MRESLEKYTYMHALLPAMNVILESDKRSTQRLAPRICMTTHRWEYTPGMRASSTACGRGSSHLSGRHVSASGPHSAGSRLHAWMLARTSVPLGSGSECTSVPSQRRIGSERGITVASAVLNSTYHGQTLIWPVVGDRPTCV